MPLLGMVLGFFSTSYLQLLYRIKEDRMVVLDWNIEHVISVFNPEF